MTIKRSGTGVIALYLCCALTGSVQAAGNPLEGKLKASTCMGCHGNPGYFNVYPTYRVPKLGGQHAEYIVSALKAYKAGQRKHGTMHANAASLSEQDMADIAAYFSAKPPASGDVN
jgi:Cytochrome c553